MKASLSDLARILVPVDFSECSHRALAYAESLARARGAQIHVLHVYPAPSGPLAERIYADVPERGRLSLAELALAEAQRDMNEFLEAAGAHDVELHFLGGNPWRRILELAEQGDYDLIVMGTHGRTGLERLIMGSVAEQVVRHAVCPVLAVHPEDAPPEPAAAPGNGG